MRVPPRGSWTVNFVTVAVIVGAMAITLVMQASVSARLQANAGKQDTPPAPPIVKSVDRPYEEYKIVPVRVHLLRDSETAAAITKLTDSDVKRIFGKANNIWHAAGIHLWVESVVAEKPASIAGFEHAATLPSEALLALRPAESRKPPMFHVYYIGEMTPNGIFMRKDGIFVKETARLRKVEGGIDEPLPRVTAHELGHGMGLPHRQDTFNLLASGTTGTLLNDAEITTVRKVTSDLPWVETPQQFMKDALKAVDDGKIGDARSMFQTLADIPGDSPIKKLAKQRIGSD